MPRSDRNTQEARLHSARWDIHINTSSNHANNVDHTVDILSPQSHGTAAELLCCRPCTYRFRRSRPSLKRPALGYAMHRR